MILNFNNYSENFEIRNIKQKDKKYYKLLFSNKVVMKEFKGVANSQTIIHKLLIIL